MIAKGLHFPNVTLVGIIYADLSLHLPDFRAGERTFQLLTQVAGRAGRGDIEGEVFVQSFTPFHPAIQYARRHDYAGFYEQEIEFRNQLQYPHRRAVLPSSRSRGGTEDKVSFLAEHFRKSFEPLMKELGDLDCRRPGTGTSRSRRDVLSIPDHVANQRHEHLEPTIGRSDQAGKASERHHRHHRY